MIASDNQQAARQGGTVAAIAVGVSLGVLPHLLGLVLGMINFLITPLLLPILASASGWWLGRRFPANRLRSMLFASASAGFAYVAAFIGQLALLARTNGSWHQTLAVDDAVEMTLGVTALALLFILIGGLLSTVKRKPKTAHL
ncbi:MAG: hypothetical protein ACK4M2_02850 [Brevundimonas sp.]